MRSAACLFALGLILRSIAADALDQVDARQDPQPEASGDQSEQTEGTETKVLPDAVRHEVDTNEDPDAKRREERELTRQQAVDSFQYDLYASARLHTINAYDANSGSSDRKLADGASRIGATGSWQFSPGWNLFGRVELGIDVLDTVSSKAQNDDDRNISPRLYNLGLESDAVYLTYGKSWSTYYQVAGATDRFSIFGGDATGVYNAGTDGGASGTGRADNALQTNLFLDFSRWTHFKPFKLNAQYQQGEPIPFAEDRKYGSALSLSAWFETERHFGVGLAWHDAGIGEHDQRALQDIGIDGDAQALALAVKAFGDNWLASFVVADIENLATTEKNLYFNGTGIELFVQWQFSDQCWLIGGGNWLEPDNGEIQAGDYEVKYSVLGLRYTLGSFKRMFYLEWRNDYGYSSDGRQNKNEITIGVRWDLG